MKAISAADRAGLVVDKPGVYLFSEGRRHLYVGRTRNLRNRLHQHCRPSVGPGASALAALLAWEAIGQVKAAYRSGRQSRKALMNTKKFKDAFKAAKKRIARMDIRYVEQTNDVRQALLEVYVATALRTRYNDFGTH